MAILIKALILVATDDPLAAEQTVFETLNVGVFESDNPILDFATGVDHVVEIGSDYTDGSFVSVVPQARYLRTANSMLLPC